jgi:LCP family protein required for cell wall assembly
MGRRWRRWLVAALVGLVLLGLGGFTAAWAYGRSINDSVKRTDAFKGVVSSARPTETVTGALNVLLLGSDSRNPDTTDSSRSDTMMLLHLDADHRHAYVISIPRDTWVYVPTSADGRNGGTMAKINSAYAWGGTPLAVQTVEGFTGVRIDHVVLIDFAGFQQVVDALGGVDMNVDQTITSIFAPHRTFEQGMQHFTGAEALDYVRQRYQFADGDFTRERHQQEFLKALLDRAASAGTLADPIRLNSFLRGVSGSITVDQDFDLVDTALQLRDLRSGDITFMTNPSAGTAWEGDQSVVRSDSAKAKALYQAVADDAVAQWLASSAANPSASPSPSVAPAG